MFCFVSNQTKRNQTKPFPTNQPTNQTASQPASQPASRTQEGIPFQAHLFADQSGGQSSFGAFCSNSSCGQNREKAARSRAELRHGCSRLLGDRPQEQYSDKHETPLTAMDLGSSLDVVNLWNPPLWNIHRVLWIAPL